MARRAKQPPAVNLHSVSGLDGDVPVETGEIGEHGNGRSGKRLCREFDDGLALVRVDFKPNSAAWFEERWRREERAANKLEAVCSTVQGETWFRGELRILGDLLRAQVGEVGEHQVDGTGNRGEQ